MSLDNPRLHRNLIPIDNETVLWQYMNLEKFEKIILSRKLFFCRASKFEDKDEGTLPIKESEYNKRKGNRQGFDSRHESEKSNTIVNCWHINTDESSYMWEEYGEKGVVIKSSLERIYMAFENTDERIPHSEVRYIDYKNDTWFNPKTYPHIEYNTFTPLIHKEIDKFQKEREFRLLIYVDTEGFDNDVYWKNQVYENGKLISVDLNCLIEKIIICPNTDEKEKELIEKLIFDAGFNFKVVNSSLDSEELY